jgi:hypothetical protein
MRLSRPALFLLRGYAALTAFALILGWPLAGAITGALGTATAVAMGCQLVIFGLLMHRIIEAVAKQAKLMPLAPMARGRLPRRVLDLGAKKINDPIAAGSRMRAHGPPLAPR